MVRTSTLVAAAATVVFNVHAESLYPKSSAVLQITGLDYDRLIANSNYTSIVEFYAPWCGHCKNLKPAFEIAAKSLAGIAKVAAVNCDEEMNKPFCGKMGVQGFPTLKIVRPSKRPGKPTVEDYQGQRDAKSIVEAVKDKIPNTVKRVTDKTLDEWLSSTGDGAKAILFSDKGLVSATLKTLAVDFAGLIPVAQIKKAESAAVEKYGIKKFPTLILLPAGSQEPIIYEGDMKKDSMVEFLSQVAPPNPDCPPAKAKSTKPKKDTKKPSKDSSKSTKSSATETVEEPIKATESPDTDPKDEPVVPPVEDVKPTIPVLAESSELQASCLTEKSLTCILAILPKDESSEAAATVLSSLAAIHHKHDKIGTKLFPFIGVPASNPLASSIISGLNLGSDGDVHLIATNGKRSWWKKYSGKSFGLTEVETWVDDLRMGEGKKEKLPDTLFAATEKAEAVEPETPEHVEL